MVVAGGGQVNDISGDALAIEGLMSMVHAGLGDTFAFVFVLEIVRDKVQALVDGLEIDEVLFVCEESFAVGYGSGDDKGSAADAVDESVRVIHLYIIRGVDGEDDFGGGDTSEVFEAQHDGSAQTAVSSQAVFFGDGLDESGAAGVGAAGFVPDLADEEDFASVGGIVFVRFFQVGIAGVGHEGGADGAGLGDMPEVAAAAGGQEPVEVLGDGAGLVGEAVEGVLIPAKERGVGGSLTKGSDSPVVEVAEVHDDDHVGLIVGDQGGAPGVGASLGQAAGPALAGDGAQFHHQVPVADGQDVVAVAEEAFDQLARDDLRMAQGIMLEIANNCYSHKNQTSKRYQ